MVNKDYSEDEAEIAAQKARETIIRLVLRFM
jgi:hypothetical protein